MFIEMPGSVGVKEGLLMPNIDVIPPWEIEGVRCKYPHDIDLDKCREYMQ